MNPPVHSLAVDLGASSGRVVLGRWDAGHLVLHELHRFPNQAVDVAGHLHWDVLRLWSEIKQGLAHYASQFDAPLSSIGVDTWGVDYALLDASGRLLANPYSYRDRRSEGMPAQVFGRVPQAEVFRQTGIQNLPINTLFQLWSQVQSRDPLLAVADTLLLMPDLFHYWLSGRKVAEYTNATTTQLLHSQDRRWATEMMAQLGLPTHLLPPLVPPGTVLGELRPEVGTEVGFHQPPWVIAPATHDTASAVAAIPDLDAGSAYLSSGTWSLMGVETQTAVLSAEAFALNFTNEGGVAGSYRLLKNIAGLWLLQACQQYWQRAGQIYPWEVLLAMAEQAQPFRSLVDPDAADFLNPGDMPAAIAAFCRRTQQPAPATPGAVVRCCLESLALKSRWVLEALQCLSARTLQTVRMVGGGSQNPLLCQWTANACGRPVIAGPAEATALGNILLQWIATQHLPDIAAARQLVASSMKRQRYDPQSSTAWERAFARFQTLLEPPQAASD